MDVRSLINDKPGLALTVFIIAAILVGGLFFRSNQLSHPKTPYVIPGHYYTADEAQSWIPDSVYAVPPFEKDGKTYVRVYLFIGNDDKPFVGYLEKYESDAHSQILAQEEPRFQRQMIDELGDRGLLVKRVADADWTPKDQLAGIAITKVIVPGTDQPAKPFFANLPPNR